MVVDQETLEDLARSVGASLQRRGWRLATAESCTGGWVAQALTAIPGSSAWFECGFVTYSNQAKQTLLGVRAETLAGAGAVSEAVVREMAEGARARSGVEVALAISGIAGPGGGSADKPVGLVWFAWAFAGQATQAAARQFAGDRRAVRSQAVAAALNGVLQWMPGL